MAKTTELLEQSLRIQEGLSKERRNQPEVLVPRLGESLIRKGLINTGDLMTALDYQKEQGIQGNPVLLGEALLELKLLSRDQLDEAVTEQISLLQDALRQSNEMLEQRVAERTEELQQALEKLTEMNRLKANFIANMSHELRTPLAHMFGYVDLLADEGLGPLNIEQKQALQVLKKSNNRLGGLIDNLLFLSFDSAEVVPLQIEDVPVSFLIDNILDGMQDKAANAQVSLQKDVEGQLRPISGDAQKLNWALTQIVDNAIKFNKKGGKVMIRVRGKENNAVISVLDTGVGIPEDKIKNVFEAFVQLDGSSTRQYGGAGLGLSLAKRIIEAHGAKLSLESKLNRGTRVSFALPFSKG